MRCVVLRFSFRAQMINALEGSAFVTATKLSVLAGKVHNLPEDDVLIIAFTFGSSAEYGILHPFFHAKGSTTSARPCNHAMLSLAAVPPGSKITFIAEGFDEFPLDPVPS